MRKNRFTIVISHSDHDHRQRSDEVASSFDAYLRDYVRNLTLISAKRNASVRYEPDVALWSKDSTYIPILIKGDASQTAPEVQGATPPAQANLLLRYALLRKYQEHIIGDLEEAYYTEWLPEHGLRHARRLYWWHAIRSIAPMLWTGVKRSGIITFIVGAADWLRDRFS